MENKVIFHIDFDYFYAQCEEIRNSKLKTKPVAVCIFSDRGEDSGAIATANYKAREYGVKSGIPIKFAKSRLKDRKDAVFIPADFEYNSRTFGKIPKIYRFKGRDWKISNTFCCC